MTRNLLRTLMVGLVTGTAACIDLDENLITGVSSEYYSTPDGLNAALIASYSQLRGFYGREQLLNDITLTVPRNAVLAIFGPASSGKSGLLRSLNRMAELAPHA